MIGETPKNHVAFDSWMRSVDAWCEKLYGVSVYDLPDCCFADWHEDGMTPKSAARKAVRSMDGDN